MRILVADDNPDHRELVIARVRRAYPDAVFLEVIRQTMLDEALASQTFDLVLTDYRLQWTDGLKVLDQVNRKSSRRTGHHGDRYRQRGSGRRRDESRTRRLRSQGPPVPSAALDSGSARENQAPRRARARARTVADFRRASPHRLRTLLGLRLLLSRGAGPDGGTRVDHPRLHAHHRLHRGRPPGRRARAAGASGRPRPDAARTRRIAGGPALHRRRSAS